MSFAFARIFDSSMASLNESSSLFKACATFDRAFFAFASVRALGSRKITFPDDVMMSLSLFGSGCIDRNSLKLM